MDEIPRPAGENAGLRDDASGMGDKLTHYPAAISLLTNAARGHWIAVLTGADSLPRRESSRLCRIESLRRQSRLYALYFLTLIDIYFGCKMANKGRIDGRLRGWGSSG